jgi:serine phosphatase RsbU (regulator of sigma subunit)
VRLTPLLVGIERCAVLKWDANAGHFTGGPSWGLTPDNRRLFSDLVLAPEDAQYMEELAAATEPHPCGTGTDCPLPPTLHKLFESPTLLGLPLIARGALVGAMLVDHPALGGEIGGRRSRILSGIAHQTALALENARLQTEVAAAERMERELEVARDIQTSFLPEQMPQIEGWEVAAFYRAARQVGGDFYDFFPVDDHHWAVVVADVADKGVPAALFMALSRTLLRAVGSNRQMPADTLKRVNHLLLRDSRSDLFVTVWYGLWDTQTGIIRYASAGHNPPLIIRADGTAERLSARGIALGVIPDIKLQEAEVTINPGDVLAAYTDGITEALRSDMAEFGMMGLESALLSLRRKPAQAIADGIVQALDGFVAGAAQFDDITMVVLKHRHDAPAAPQPHLPPMPRIFPTD